MTTQQQIKNYLHTATGGAVNITLQQAADIIQLAYSSNATISQAMAKLYRYNDARQLWEFIRTIQTNDAEINAQIIKALDGRQQLNFYKYELYDSDGLPCGNIYSVNPCLF